jgi:hypothetical protein
LPINLEAYADSWVIKVAVACIYHLGLTVIPGRKAREDEIQIVDQWEHYLHGLAAAIKQGSSVSFSKFSGKFGEGYYWACSQVDDVQQNKEFFRYNWKNPYIALLGKTVWTADAPDWARNWYNLVLQTCKRLKLADPIAFCRSQEELHKNLLRSEFNFEKGAVFTEEERARMADSLHEIRSTYENLKRDLKKPSMSLIRSWKEQYAEKVKPLLDMDNSLSAIVTERVQLIYSLKQKKKLGKGAFTLGDRLSTLDDGEYIRATNPTGLMGDPRIPFRADPRQGQNDLYEEFTNWATKNGLTGQYDQNPLVRGWVLRISQRLKSTA